jgi:hypothetical protein
VSATLIGYARCSMDEQHLTGQRPALLGLAVCEDRSYPTIARATAKPNGEQPKLSAWRQAHPAALSTGEHPVADPAEPFSASGLTSYRVLERGAGRPAAGQRGGGSRG